MKSDSDRFFVEPIDEPIEPPDHVRVVLMQARETDDPMRRHEVACFARHLHLRIDRLEIFNILNNPLEDVKTMLRDPHVRVIIGGSGTYSVSKGGPKPLQRFVRETIPRIVDRGLPTIGACWGYHAMVAGLGGEVVATGVTEIGTHEIRKVTGSNDRLMSHMPDRFEAQMGHNDWVMELPHGAVALCENDLSPHQAARFGDAPVYGLQFHAELDDTANRNRYLHYIEHYGSDDSESPRFAPTPHPNNLLRQFLELFCLEDY